MRPGSRSYAKRVIDVVHECAPNKVHLLDDVVSNSLTTGVPALVVWELTESGSVSLSRYCNPSVVELARSGIGQRGNSCRFRTCLNLQLQPRLQHFELIVICDISTEDSFQHEQWVQHQSIAIVLEVCHHPGMTFLQRLQTESAKLNSSILGTRLQHSDVLTKPSDVRQNVLQS